MTREVCVVIAGDKFDPAVHVKNIHYRLSRFCTDFRLTVLTDNPSAVMPHLPSVNSRILKLPDWNLDGMRSLWWYKIYMFSPDIHWLGPVLYMDLDTIIINNIDKFWDYEPGKFAICHDFNRQFVPTYPISNSSVLRFEPQRHLKLYNNWIKDPKKWQRQFRGDQDYISDFFKSREDASVWWPRDWAMSYKWKIKHGGSRKGGLNLVYPDDYYEPDQSEVIPENCSIVVFHGKPDPFETDFGRQHLNV